MLTAVADNQVGADKLPIERLYINWYPSGTAFDEYQVFPGSPIRLFGAFALMSNAMQSIYQSV